jgi:TrmH family RNA methyltransferase
MMITSKSNPKVKYVRALRSRKGREQAQAFLVEGIRPLGDAIDAKMEIEALYYSPESLHSEYGQKLVDILTQANVACYALAEDVFDSICEKENPQGLLAVIKIPQSALVDYDSGNFPWVVALVAPQDPGNIGTILRTIDAAGASGLLLLDDPLNHQYCAEAFHPNAVRASMGAIFWLPVVRQYQRNDTHPLTFEQFTQWASDYEYTIYGTSAHARQDIHSFGFYKRPAILLLGSEQKGLTPEQSRACHYLLRLPMHGRSSSLNLAVAAGVFLYDMLKKSS